MTHLAKVYLTNIEKIENIVAFSAKIVIMRHLRKMKLVLLLSQMNLRMLTITRQVPDKYPTTCTQIMPMSSNLSLR